MFPLSSRISWAYSPQILNQSKATSPPSDKESTTWNTTSYKQSGKRETKPLKMRGCGLKRLLMTSDKKCKLCHKFLPSNPTVWLSLRSIPTAIKTMRTIIKVPKSSRVASNQIRRNKNQIKSFKNLAENWIWWSLALNSSKTIKKSTRVSYVFKLILNIL